ncbi:MAG TPA: hypothetical protein VMC78_15335 [Mycobacterium sp.]|nr:hypothetical protein [Mycobacterium sp.]
MTWDGDYTITVYCDGPADARHERYVVISYVRLFGDDLPAGRDWVPARQWIDASGRVRLTREHQVHQKRSRPQNSRLRDAGIPHVHYQYRFPCGRCKFDERRKIDLRSADRLDGVFDRLAEDGEYEISVRELIERAWG